MTNTSKRTARNALAQLATTLEDFFASPTDIDAGADRALIARIDAIDNLVTELMEEAARRPGRRYEPVKIGRIAIGSV